jgi:hypothetical protein
LGLSKRKIGELAIVQDPSEHKHRFNSSVDEGNVPGLFIGLDINVDLGEFTHILEGVVSLDPQGTLSDEPWN